MKSIPRTPFGMMELVDYSDGVGWRDCVNFHLLPHLLNVRMTVITDRSGNKLEVPAIIVNGEPVRPLLRYFVDRYSRSYSWMLKVRYALRLFLEYSIANAPNEEFGRIEHKQAAKRHQHFTAFASALLHGTIDKNGNDPSGLWWSGRKPQNVTNAINCLTQYFDYLKDTRNNTLATSFNPVDTTNNLDQLIARAAYEHRRSKAFLGHIWNAERRFQIHLVRVERPAKVRRAEPPRFPDHHFARLIMEGFHVNGRPNYRNILITLLLHGAGFRESEAFHLYVEDVTEDPAIPGSALVRIHHPSQGIAPASWRDANGRRISGSRKDYLLQKYGLRPRDDLINTLHAGWKGGLHEDSKAIYKQAYWFTPQFGQVFWKCWIQYMKQAARFRRDHPYAFISLAGENAGAPYKLGAYNKAHTAAVIRAKLVHRDSRESMKLSGLTSQGHRHAYGTRLERAGLGKKLIQRFLHHANPDSQDVYTQADSSEAMEALVAAAERLGIESTDDLRSLAE